MAVAQGVMAGRPEWPLYQSRLVAPLLIRLLGNDVRAYLLLIFIALVVGGFLSWNLSGLAGLAIYHAGFAFLLCPLFYPWDSLEPVFFMAFVSMVAARRSHWWFVALYAVAIFNRQTAQFMAGWMIVDPVLRWMLGARLDRKMIASGISCLIAGAAMIWILQGRAGLNRIKIGDADVTNYFHYRLVPNLSDFDIRYGILRNVGFHVSPLFLFTMVALILSAIAFLVLRDTGRFLGLSLMYLAILVALPVFGILSETRVFLDFIPLFVVTVAIDMPPTYRLRSGGNVNGA
ncbi:MAG TPA: hypothetical protein VKV03_09945 [Candidatus Binataceae bacterium]|nr:hypothetical protein [Candidatus Binataceae bacterium]